MNDFEKIPGTACVKNGSSVVVNFDDNYPRDPDLVAYEVNGVRYWVRAKAMTSGNESYYEVDVTYVFQEGAPTVRDPVELPKELIDRMREDLPKAYAAFGLKCVVKEYKPDEFRMMPYQACVRNGLGVMVKFVYGQDSMYYAVNGVRYLMHKKERQQGEEWTYEIDLRRKTISREGEYVALPKELLDRMREDLPKACAAYYGRKCIFKNEIVSEVD